MNYVTHGEQEVIGVKNNVRFSHYYPLHIRRLREMNFFAEKNQDIVLIWL